MKNQLSLLTEEAFESTDSQEERLRKAQAKLEGTLTGVSCVGNDCFYYLAAGACVLHGDVMDCGNCYDYKSINGDEDEDDEDDGYVDTHNLGTKELTTMKKTEATPMHCSLCGAEHDDDRVVKEGWFGIYKTDKMCKIKRLICPACLKRILVNVNQN